MRSWEKLKGECPWRTYTEGYLQPVEWCRFPTSPHDFACSKRRCTPWHFAKALSEEDNTCECPKVTAECEFIGKDDECLYDRRDNEA